MHNERTPEGLHAALRNVLQALKARSRERYKIPTTDDLERARIDHATEYRNLLDCERVEAGDYCAVTIGPLTLEVASAAKLTPAQARRYLAQLEKMGLAMREPPERRLGGHHWWPTGFSDELQQERHEARAKEAEQ